MILSVLNEKLVYRPYFYGLHVGMAWKSDKQQFSSSVADFYNFLMIFAILYEHVYTDHNSMFYKLDYRVIR